MNCNKENSSIFTEKPWSNWFPKNPIRTMDSEETLYVQYKKQNADNLSNTAIIDYINDKAYTHADILEMTDKTAAGLNKIGIGLNSYVGILSNSSVEEAVLLLALNKIGAVSKFVDFTKGSVGISHSLDETDLSTIVTDEMFLPIIESVNHNNLPVVVINEKHIHSEYGQAYSFSQLMNIADPSDCNTVEFRKNKPSVIITSSGTTGAPKPIVHTDESLNLAVQRMLYADFPLTRDNMLIKVIPAHIGLGLITSLYTALICGTKLVMIAGAGPEETMINFMSFFHEYSSFIDRHSLDKNAKVNIFASPQFFRILLPDNSITDLSFVGGMLAGGAKMEKEEADRLEQISKQKGCVVPVCNGYGQNEIAGAFSLNTNNHNKNGSAGFPTIGSELRIVDKDTLKLLDTNQEGKILEKSTSQFLYYLNMPEQTEASIVTLDDGSEWFDTNDLGYIDHEGFLFITGRTSRVVNRFDCKISIDSVEEKIRRNKLILDCAIISVPEKSKDMIAFVIVAENKDVTSLNVLDIIQKGDYPLSKIEMPVEIHCLSQIPYLNSGKIDYKTLKEKYLKIVSN